MSPDAMSIEQFASDIHSYLDNLSLATIARVLNPPLSFALLGPEQRASMLIDPAEVDRRKSASRHRGRMSAWCIWTITDISTPDIAEPHLTGLMLDRQDRESYITTSAVLAIASDLSCAFTKSGSSYELVQERGDLTRNGLFHLVCVLNTWGMGTALGLPPLMY